MSAHPSEIDALVRSASAALQAGDWPAAERTLTACLALRPDDPAVSYNLALVEKRLGKPAEAERRLAGVLAAVPRHAKARFEYAASLMDRGEEVAALREFEVCLDREPDDPDARLNAARLCLRLGAPSVAEMHLAAAARWGRGDPAIRLAQAEAARDLGRDEEAQELFRALYRDAPQLRPAILKSMSQGRRGRVPIAASRLSG